MLNFDLLCQEGGVPVPEEKPSRTILSGQMPLTSKPQKNKCSCLEVIRETLPALVNSSHKGQQGRIGIIGGCQEFNEDNRSPVLQRLLILRHYWEPLSKP